ncbi:hypothetical protein ACFSB1_18205 [Halopseudomonas phragmitis]|uniref:Uncharacterized protein n=1 Tax=Halopseudomonas phragmitis TaxID=1931241 RepID=A0A1V0B5R7_9GAMM|nr:hypothetical protein [Halopseudomonas phragmitis]AQZ95278.1 hypothetical protein BVH74_11170 [Halopseudomonas phragmitis]
MIDYDQVLYADRYGLVQRAGIGRRGNLLVAIKNLFFTVFRFPECRSCEFLFFRSLVRGDYKNLLSDVASSVGSGERVIVEDYIRKSSKPALRAFWVVFKLLPRFFSFKADSFYERVFLYLRLCFYYRILAAVSKFEFGVLVLFADMQPTENLLAQYFRRKGKKTVTLQHGLYADYRDYPTVNVINYLHQPSEYFLAWGRDTAELICRSGDNRKVVICGKPSVAVSSPVKKAREEGKAEGLKYFTVVLDQNVFQEQNVEMLGLMVEYAKSKDLIMNVRYHPGNNRRFYADLCAGCVSDLDLDGSVFVVGHTSSLLHEMMVLGVPVFKFLSDIPCVTFPDDLVFDSIDDLRKVMGAARETDFRSLSNEYIAYFGDESLEKYGEFFSALKNDRAVALYERL